MWVDGRRGALRGLKKLLPELEKQTVKPREALLVRGIHEGVVVHLTHKAGPDIRARHHARKKKKQGKSITRAKTDTFPTPHPP